MTVIILTACPEGLRGHLTQWLLEISAGVYVGPVRSLVELSLAGEHRRGHGSLYTALACGRLDVPGCVPPCQRVPLSRAADGRLVLAKDNRASQA
jgi:hypothetical protein